MHKDVKQALKILTGILIVPFGIIANALWPWWQKQNLALKIVSGILILPFTLIAGPLTKWWDDF